MFHYILQVPILFYFFYIITFGGCKALPSLTSSSIQYKTRIVSAEEPKIDIVRWLIIKEKIKMHISDDNELLTFLL